MIYIGIDPGKTGAVAVIGPAGLVQVWDCPTMQVRVNNKAKDVADPALMANLLRRVEGENIHAFLEKVSAMPGQGVTSMFTFGTNFGMWQGILAALQIPYTLVTPQAWKKVVMDGMDKSSKDAGRVRAIQLWPKCAEQLSRKKDIGRADAMLIAEYGRRCDLLAKL